MRGHHTTSLARLLGVMGLAGALATSSCKDDGAASECRSVVDAYCARFVDCYPEASVDGCTSMVATSMGRSGCSEAIATKDRQSLDGCRGAVDALACESLRTIPVSCKGLFLYER